MYELIILTTPTLDNIIRPNMPPERRPGGPGIYLSKAGSLLGYRTLVLGGLNYRHLPPIERAHRENNADLLPEHTGCTQHYTLAYNHQGQRIALALNRCPLTRSPRRAFSRILHATLETGPHTPIVWAPLWGAGAPEQQLLKLLLNHTPNPIVLDLQPLARDPRNSLTLYIDALRSTRRTPTIAHADRHEIRTICNRLGSSSLKECIRTLGVKELIISNGPHAVHLHTPHTRIIARPPYIVENPDPTGAGEVLLSTYTILRSRGEPPREALEKAVETATRHVEHQTLRKTSTLRTVSSMSSSPAIN